MLVTSKTKVSIDLLSIFCQLLYNQFMAEYCPIQAATKIFGDFWSILIIRELLVGPKRFNEIQDAIEGITSTTLSARLKKLTEAGILERKQFESIPPKVEYRLTKKGLDLGPFVNSIEEFASKYY